MEIEEIRQKLHQFIDSMEDKKAEAMYALFENELGEEEGEYTDEFKAELDEMEAYYDNGGQMISAEEMDRQIRELRRSKSIEQDV